MQTSHRKTNHLKMRLSFTDLSFSATLEQYFVSVMSIILTRLQNRKTEGLSLRFVRFYHFISAHDDKGYSADFFIQVVDKVQEG